MLTQGIGKIPRNTSTHALQNWQYTSDPGDKRKSGLVEQQDRFHPE
jgi:hypothetical protein